MSENMPENTKTPAYDAILLVCQDNNAESITVDLASEAVKAHLGYDTASLQGKSLFDLLDDTTRETVEGMVEYEEDSRDLSQVLRRVRSIKFKHKNGDSIEMAVKTVREVTPDDKHWFRLILSDEQRQDQERILLKALRDKLAQYKTPHAITGLPVRQSAEKYLEKVVQFYDEHKFPCCFALVQVDRFAKNDELYGDEACYQLLSHVANVCERNFRSGDIITQLDNHTLGVFLFNVDVEAAKLALNRLRWAVTSHRIPFGGKQEFSVTVSVAFQMISSDTTVEAMGVLENALLSLPEDRRNMLLDKRALAA